MTRNTRSAAQMVTKKPSAAKKVSPAPQPSRSLALENALAAVSELCANVGTPAGIDLDLYLESIDAGMTETQALAVARQEGDAPLAVNADTTVR